MTSSSDRAVPASRRHSASQLRRCRAVRGSPSASSRPIFARKAASGSEVTKAPPCHARRATVPGEGSMGAGTGCALETRGA